MSKSYININGEQRESSALEFPKTKREFRNAWQFNGNIIEVDMVKARNLVRNKLREIRVNALGKLDAEYMKAQEQGKDTSEIVKAKEWLRNLPTLAAIETCQTDEELSDLVKKIEDQIKAERYGTT